jgi:putative ABC transport system substrate-binding protein
MFKNPPRSLATALRAAAVAAVLVPVIAAPVSAASVGLTWYSKSNTANLVARNFLEHMKKIAPDVSVEVKRELADNDALAATVSAFDSSKDAIIVLRSHGSKFLKKNPTKKPGFIGGGNDPVALGVLENMEHPEGNITGVTQAIPHVTSLQAFMTIMPSLSKLTVLLQKGHPASAVDRKGAETGCKKLQLSCEFFEAADAKELIAKAASVKGDGVALALGSQSLINNEAKNVVAAAPTTPVFAFSERPIKDGATAGLVADNAKLGRKLAEMVLDAIRNGKPVRDLPVAVDEEPALKLNMTSVARLGITIPPEILNSATIVE